MSGCENCEYSDIIKSSSTWGGESLYRNSGKCTQESCVFKESEYRVTSAGYLIKRNPSFFEMIKYSLGNADWREK